jgi:predicted small metal-binding protein
MSRRYIDCRDFPSDISCTVALSADSDDELMEAVVQHGCKVHGYEDTPEFRSEIQKAFKDGTPPA